MNGEAFQTLLEGVAPIPANLTEYCDYIGHRVLMDLKKADPLGLLSSNVAVNYTPGTTTEILTVHDRNGTQYRITIETVRQ